MKEIININTITELHKILGFEKPKHPLVSVHYHAQKSADSNIIPGGRYALGLYNIGLKSRMSGSISYGRNSYDWKFQ